MRKLFSLVFLLSFFLLSDAQEIPKWKINQLVSFINQASHPTIINFWATFCKPCIEEIPYFQKMVKKYEKNKVQLLFVSLDLPEDYTKIKSFASKRQITAPIVFLDETNADIFCPQINKQWSGSIPASLIINPKTGYQTFLEDQLSEAKLEALIKTMINEKDQ